MKKTLTVLLATLFCLIFTFSVSAEGFVSSPSNNKAPELVEGKNEDEDCEADIVIVPYSERHTLDEAKREKLEEAYDQIVKASESDEFKKALEAVSKEMKIPVADLAVSDLFDVSYVGCVDHEDHGYFRIKLKAETLKNFVALLHFDGAKWTKVADAKVDDEIYLTFTADDFSPFAVVVRTGNSGAGGENTTGQRFPWEYIVIMAVAAIGCVTALIIYKKKKA